MRRCLPALVGLAGLAWVVFPARAGQPIQFSSPNKDVDTPPKKEIFVEPKRTIKWSFTRPEDDIPPPPPIFIDPVLERKLRERREERRNWLFKEPELFRDKFTDPFKLRADPTETKTSLDEAVERILGKPDEKETKQREQEKTGRIGPLFSDEPLFDRDKTGKADGLSQREREKKGNERDWRNSAERSVKSLFDPTATDTALPVQPGMSLYEMLGAVKDKTQRRDEERRRSEFTRLINPHAVPTPPPRGSLFDPINNQEDLTRVPVNPITPVVGSSLPEANVSRSSFLAAPRPVETVWRPVPFSQPASPFQPLPTPAAAENKSRQIESLKLMNRPAMLEFPSRRF